MKTYTRQQAVMFQHCDPAGIVFYPRYFEMINATVESWFAEEVQWSFQQMHQSDHIAVPTASLQTRFLAPSYLGDELQWTLTITRIGNSSLQLQVCASCEQQTRVECDLVLVLTSGIHFKAVPWPAAIRQKLQLFGIHLEGEHS